MCCHGVLHLDRNLHIGLLPHRLLPIVMQYGIHRIIFAEPADCIRRQAFPIGFHILRNPVYITALHTALQCLEMLAQIMAGAPGVLNALLQDAVLGGLHTRCRHPRSRNSTPCCSGPARYRPPRSGRWPGAPRPHRRKPQYIRPGCTSSKSRAS